MHNWFINLVNDWLSSNLTKVRPLFKLLHRGDSVNRGLTLFRLGYPQFSNECADSLFLGTCTYTCKHAGSFGVLSIWR